MVCACGAFLLVAAKIMEPVAVQTNAVGCSPQGIGELVVMARGGASEPAFSIGLVFFLRAFWTGAGFSTSIAASVRTRPSLLFV
ncbi:hypothetical protein BL241_00515 [Ralstonia solanacearum]|nr:hypothetical protein BL241_00515 [Ralstonia solanacearum]